jgi:hypothetical protein
VQFKIASNLTPTVQLKRKEPLITHALTAEKSLMANEK